jgi:hypothetical protein
VVILLTVDHLKGEAVMTLEDLLEEARDPNRVSPAAHIDVGKLLKEAADRAGEIALQQEKEMNAACCPCCRKYA